MDTELLQALGAEVAEQMHALRGEIRREAAEQIAVVQRAHTEEVTTLRARLAETDHRLELAQQALAGLRTEAGDPVAALMLDAAGVLHLVQRGGAHWTVALPDAAALVEAAGKRWREDMRAELAGELQASVARTFEQFCNAPVWSATAVYTEGDIVATDVGRTYRVRKGVRATLGRRPGDDAEHWERLGTGGFRVHKTRPEALAAGDVFTERDARFMHDGEATILFVPAGAKVSDIERAVKGPHGLAQATQAELRELAGRVAGLLEDVQRNATAANDAGELGVQALAATERVHAELEAMRARLDQLAAGGAS
jgi:hypothetical protein